MKKQNEAPKKKKKGKIIAICIIAFILINNTIATKIIYDNIFKGYHEPVRYSTDAYTELMESREAVEFECGNNTLVGYYYDNEESEKLVVIAPGIHAGADDYISVTSYLVDNGFDVFAFDPTGTDSSEGNSCRSYSQETYDLDAALTYLEQNYEYETINLIGHSRGATAACAMMESDHEIDSIVSVSGFNCAMDAIIGLSSSYIGPVAYINYPTLWAYQLTLVKYDDLQFHTDRAAAESDIPLLILQGSEDDTALVDSHSTYSYFVGQDYDNVTLLLKEGAGHTDILYDSETGDVNEDTMQDLLAFLL